MENLELKYELVVNKGKEAYEESVTKWVQYCVDLNASIPIPVLFAPKEAQEFLEHVDCTGCGALCCKKAKEDSKLVVTDFDVKLLKRMCSWSQVVKFRNTFVDENVKEKKRFVILPCLMLRFDECSIYSGRPMACRLYPIVGEGKLKEQKCTVLSCLCPVAIEAAKTIYNSLYEELSSKTKEKVDKT